MCSRKASSLKSTCSSINTVAEDYPKAKDALVNIVDALMTELHSRMQLGIRCIICPNARKLSPSDGNPSTYGTPNDSFQGEDAKGRPIEIFWWNQLHVRDVRWLEFTVIRVVRPHAKNSERDPRESWFVWLGDPQVDLAHIAMEYAFLNDCMN